MDIVKPFLYQKSQFDLVERRKDKDKNGTHTSLFKSSEDGKQEFFYVALEKYKGESFRAIWKIVFKRTKCRHF